MTEPFCQPGKDRHSQTRGFSLLELLVALSLGIGLSGAILQLLFNESDVGLRMNRLLREKSVQQRTLALIREDVQRSSRISINPELEQHACSLAGRLPVLHLSTTAGPITYSVGTAPSAIWRGLVLMRCGPAFDLSGQPSADSNAQNRVVIDGLAVNPEAWQGCSVLVKSSAMPPQDLAGSSHKAFSGCLQSNGNSNVLGVRLEQVFTQGPGQSQQIRIEALLSTAV